MVMAFAGSHASLAVGYAGSVVGVAGGLTAAVTPDTATGQGGLAVGMVSASVALVAVFGDKVFPHLVRFAETFAGVVELRANLADLKEDLKQTRAARDVEIAKMREDLDRTRAEAVESKIVAIRAQDKLDFIERQNKAQGRAILDNSDQIAKIRGSSDEHPAAGAILGESGPGS